MDRELVSAFFFGLGAPLVLGVGIGFLVFFSSYMNSDSLSEATKNIFLTPSQCDAKCKEKVAEARKEIEAESKSRSRNAAIFGAVAAFVCTALLVYLAKRQGVRLMYNNVVY